MCLQSHTVSEIILTVMQQLSLCGSHKHIYSAILYTIYSFSFFFIHIAIILLHSFFINSIRPHASHTTLNRLLASLGMPTKSVPQHVDKIHGIPSRNFPVTALSIRSIQSSGNGFKITYKN